MKNNVIFSFLGTVLDKGMCENRWDLWRPSVAICQYKDLLISKYHFFYEAPYSILAEQIIEDIKHVSSQTDILPHLISLKDPWDFEEVYGILYNFTKQCRFYPEKEEYLIHMTTGTHVIQICLFLLAESYHLPGKLLQSIPPDKKEIKGPGAYTIIDLNLSRYNKIASLFKKEITDDTVLLKSGIRTCNKAFNALIEKIEVVAVRSKYPLLLFGPTGSGKSLLARRIYELKKIHHQVAGNFVEINCATLRGDTAISTLFGHKRGAFTGAVKDRTGLLKTADTGLLFLDEIGELGPDEQAMLLRAIEEKKFLPLGSDKESKSDFQFICATNRDLEKDVRLKRFREDLFARINLWTFTLPALKERPEDIEPNIDYELQRYTKQTGYNITFTVKAKKMFLTFATSSKAEWRSNFRDLNGAVTRMATLAVQGRITTIIVEQEIARLKKTWHTQESEPDQELLPALISKKDYEAIDLFDRIQLEGILRICQECNSLSKAGRILFSQSRKLKQKPNDADRLRKYLKRFKIDWNDI